MEVSGYAKMYHLEWLAENEPELPERAPPKPPVEQAGAADRSETRPSGVPD